MYSGKTSEELIELLEARDEEIEELECKAQSIEDLEDEIRTLSNEIAEHDESLSDREEVSEKAFNAGYDACDSDCKGSYIGKLKRWLNFKMEARL